MIKAYWHTGDGNNFGDVISPFIISKMTGREVVYSSEADSFCSIGSIAYFPYTSRKTFWGSGIISKDQKSSLVRDHTFLAIRGPNSRRKIMLDGGLCPEVYGDPGMLLPYLFPKEEFNIEKRKKISIFPHWVDLKHVSNFRQVKSNEVNVIDIRNNYLDVILEAISSDFLICSSLHALILGESYGIPSIYCRFGNKLTGGDFKFEDYFNSTNRQMKMLDHRRKIGELDIAKCFELYDQMDPLEVDLNKFLKAFPYEIKNKNLLELLK